MEGEQLTALVALSAYVTQSPPIVGAPTPSTHMLKERLCLSQQVTKG